eukprot:6214818-Pleurochrysis_carterae.AAC.10
MKRRSHARIDAFTHHRGTTFWNQLGLLDALKCSWVSWHARASSCACNPPFCLLALCLRTPCRGSSHIVSNRHAPASLAEWFSISAILLSAHAALLFLCHKRSLNSVADTDAISSAVVVLRESVSLVGNGHASMPLKLSCLPTP